MLPLSSRVIQAALLFGTFLGNPDSLLASYAESWERAGNVAPISAFSTRDSLEARSSLRISPVELADGDQTLGWAWLEGQRVEGLAVRFLPVTPSGQAGPVETVSPSGPGSQMALRGAVLPRGRILLVWAAYDGEDDEILWSLREASGGWSIPRRAHAPNTVPDITPALVATGETALLAWSRYDVGEYRSRVAQFTGSDFQDHGWIGEPGLLFPAFVGGGDRPLLLLRSARLPGWTLFSLDRTGNALQRLQVVATSTEPPQVERTPKGARFRWNQETVEAIWTQP